MLWSFQSSYAHANRDAARTKASTATGHRLLKSGVGARLPQTQLGHIGINRFAKPIHAVIALLSNRLL